MDVLISIDMEGISGIASRRQVSPGASRYDVGCALMTAETNAAVAGAFDGGATSVVVNDSHGPMDNLIAEELDPRVEVVVGSPKPLSMVQEVRPGVGVALFVGYHAGPQESVGVLAHTHSGIAFADITLNGAPLTELWLNALVAGASGVPVGLVTGDDAICAVTEKLLPKAVTVPVKTAIGLTAARSLHPAKAREAVRAGAREAVQAAVAGRLSPLAAPDELVLEAEFRAHGVAELAVRVPGAERRSSRVVRRRVDDPGQLQDVIVLWALLATAHAASNTP